MSTTPTAPEKEVAALSEELVKIQATRVHLDAREALIYERLGEISAIKRKAGTNATRIPVVASAQPILRDAARGQGARLFALLLERPRPELRWLNERMYGQTETRQKLSSLLSHYKSKRGGEILGRDARGGHVAKEAEARRAIEEFTAKQNEGRRAVT